MADLSKFSALSIASDASIRRVIFEAADVEEARAFAVRHGFGFEGLASTASISSAGPVRAEPEAYNATQAMRILGGISRTKLYQLRVTGKLKQLPDTRSVMITRKSIEAYLALAA